MTNHTLVAILVLMASLLNAQNVTDRIAHITFDDCTATDITGQGNSGTIIGNYTCSCGVKGQAMQFDGLSNIINFGGGVEAFLSRNNFTLSFFFKPQGTGIEYLYSKQDTCGDIQALNARLQYSNLQTVTQVSESATQGHLLPARLNPGACWYHYALKVRNNTATVYINGELVNASTLTGTLDILNRQNLLVGYSPCRNEDGSEYFTGLIDEIQIFNRPLEDIEIELIYNHFSPNTIVRSAMDRIIFLGEQTQAIVSSQCVASYLWSPATGLSDPLVAEPIMNPTDTTIYRLTMVDSLGCVTVDSVRIIVLDPDSFDCAKVLIPTGFTPNGDRLNDKLFIDNAPVLDELIAFQIFDRWGTKLFETNSKTEGWDGTYEGSPMNPGVYLARIRYNCNGRENVVYREVNLIK